MRSKTKEEIINENGLDFSGESIQKIMDIYAQQEAIAFANWLQYQEMDGRSTEKLYKDFKEAIV